MTCHRFAAGPGSMEKYAMGNSGRIRTSPFSCASTGSAILRAARQSFTNMCGVPGTKGRQAVGCGGEAGSKTRKNVAPGRAMSRTVRFLVLISRSPK
jgi:hypothetical protein